MADVQINIKDKSNLSIVEQKIENLYKLLGKERIEKWAAKNNLSLYDLLKD